jgi:uncharacterized SAM-dependent methyltransferase
LNRDLDADFDVDRFRHEAIWNDADSRREMYLISTRAQAATVAGRTFRFEEGERILTEYSHKYSLDGFSRIADSYQREGIWKDAREWFCVQLLRAERDSCA